MLRREEAYGACVCVCVGVCVGGGGACGECVWMVGGYGKRMGERGTTMWKKGMGSEILEIGGE